MRSRSHGDRYAPTYEATPPRLAKLEALPAASISRRFFDFSVLKLNRVCDPSPLAAGFDRYGEIGSTLADPLTPPSPPKAPTQCPHPSTYGEGLAKAKAAQQMLLANAAA